MGLALLRRAVGLLAASVALAAPVHAQPDQIPGDMPPPIESALLHRPEVAGRVARLFDFEEQTTNPLPVPMQWLRAQNDPGVRERPGFPIWNEATLDYTSPAVSGRGSLRLAVRGGSASLRLNPGVIPIFFDGNYMVTAMVRTENLTHARAQLTVRMLDANAKPIPEAEFHSQLMRTRGQWQQIALMLPGRFESAAFLQIDLELLQPQAFLPPELQSPLKVMAEDFHGRAWFDDVAVLQLPRIELDSGHPGQVVVAPAVPKITALVQDLTSDQLTARLVIYSADGRILEESIQPVDRLRQRVHWTPRITEYGWYRIGLEVLTPLGRVGSSYLDLIYVPEFMSMSGEGSAKIGQLAKQASLADRQRLSLLLDQLPYSIQSSLPSILGKLGVSSISLPMWDQGLMTDDLPKHYQQLTELVTLLRREWVHVGLSMPLLPRELAAELRLDEHDVVQGLAQVDPQTDRFFMDGLERFGQRVDRWRLGMPGDRQTDDDAKLAADLADVRNRIRTMVPGPRIALGWPADTPLPDLSSQSPFPITRFDILLPVGLPSESFSELAEQWAAQRGTAELSLVLEAARTEDVGARAVADDLVKRAVEAWAVLDRDTDRLALQTPWGESSFPHAQVGASPALAAWRTLTEQLVGRRVVGSWNFAAGVRCLILAPHSSSQSEETIPVGGALVLWADGPIPTDFKLRSLLSYSDVEVVDVFSNRWTIPPTVGDEPHYREHVIPVSSSPVFVVGIDTDLVRLLASVRLDPPNIQAMAGQHNHALIVENPGQLAMEAQVSIVAPGRIEPGRPTSERAWFITPRRQTLAIRSGDSTRLPMDISFFPGIESGSQEMVVDLLLLSAPTPTWIRTVTPFELGLDYLDVELTLRLSPDGDDAIVEATFSNTGDTDLMIEATAFAEGYPRQRLPTITLRAGQSVTRLTPPFTSAGERLAGQRISMSVVDRERQARINKSVILPTR